MRLRSLTISEKPTSASREASLRTVGEVVTVFGNVPSRFGGWTEDYSLRRRAIQVARSLFEMRFAELTLLYSKFSTF